MTEDARISTALPSHPKTKKLMRRLGNDGCWALVCLFLWTARSRSNGDLAGLSDEDLELAANWAGGDGKFVAALAEVGFLDGDEGARKIHDWAEHNPWAAGASERSKVAKAAAAAKWGGAKSASQTRAQRLAEARQKATHTPEEWTAMLVICDHQCLNCGATFDIVKDHITPIYQGGSDGIENLQPLCRSCNSSKGPDAEDLRPADWSERLRNACGTPAPARMMPAPSPSPSPSPNQEEQAPAAQPRAKKIGLDAFLAECAAIGEPPIKPDDPIYDYAASIGLPEAFLVLAWQEFKARRRSNKQAGIRGWRQHFRDAVKQNWFHLWYAKDETWELTTAGKQAQRAAA